MSQIWWRNFDGDEKIEKMAKNDVRSKSRENTNWRQKMLDNEDASEVARNFSRLTRRIIPQDVCDQC